MKRRKDTFAGVHAVISAWASADTMLATYVASRAVSLAKGEGTSAARPPARPVFQILGLGAERPDIIEALLNAICVHSVFPRSRAENFCDRAREFERFLQRRKRKPLRRGDHDETALYSPNHT